MNKRLPISKIKFCFTNTVCEDSTNLLFNYYNYEEE